MKPLKFKEHNIMFTKPANMTDKECSSLYAYSDGKQIISKVHGNYKEKNIAANQSQAWLNQTF